MPERINRRDIIIKTAERLFVERGYNATSVRQIADEVGCTEAALYYHFKDGKRALLQSVVACQLPRLMHVLENCREAQSLEELVAIYGRSMAKVGPERMDKVRWMLAEFPNLTTDERAFIHNKFLTFHEGLAQLLAQFIKDEDKANRIAWVIFLGGLGYGQMFYAMDMRSVVGFSPEAYFATLSELIR